MNNLVIGNTSQLAFYFPADYEKISSRNINLDLYKNKFYDRVFLCFAEQRTFLENSQPILFYETNVKYTLSLIDFFKDRCNKVIVYGTSELWNKYEGPIDVNFLFKYNSTVYIDSKHQMCNEIKNNNYKNVIVLHPYNFNSIYRKAGFLFSKIFDSIINKTKIEIGDTYFYRELIHPKYVVERSILAEEDEIIGSGRLIFVNDFIRKLYLKSGLKYEDYVTENFNNNLYIIRKINYLDSKIPKYTNLINDTLDDFKL